jgi:hypothetical protein
MNIVRTARGAALAVLLAGSTLAAQEAETPASPTAGSAPAAARGDSVARGAKPKAGTATKGTAAKPAAKKPAAKRAPTPDTHPAYAGHPLDSLWRNLKTPKPLPGSILPGKRVIAFYGNPLSKRMGILGEFPQDEMLRKLDEEVAAWRKADPSTPVQPALHLIAVVAQGAPGRDGKYRLRMDSALIEKVYGWARSRNALLFVDVQVGHSTLRQELPWLERFLKRPDVHLGIDPEFSMKDGKTPPGRKIGTFDAADINYAADYLAGLVTKYNLPPKVLVVHRFTRKGVTNADRIELDPRVQIVMHMDGFGAPWLKLDSFHHYIKREPVQFVGWKQFTKPKNDNPRTSRETILKLYPTPVYVQVQ